MFVVIYFYFIFCARMCGRKNSKSDRLMKSLLNPKDKNAIAVAIMFSEKNR